MALIGDYNVGLSSNKWVANFEIPDNCEYTVTSFESIDYINITLMDGETDPSTTLVWKNVNFTNDTNLLDLQFTQTDKNGTVTKPKATVTNL